MPSDFWVASKTIASHSSFVAHNKDLAPVVESRIDHTEAFVVKIVRDIEPGPCRG